MLLPRDIRYKPCPVNSGHLSFLLAINLKVNVIENEIDAVLHLFLLYFQVNMHFLNVCNKHIRPLRERNGGSIFADKELRCFLYCRQLFILVCSGDSVNLWFCSRILEGVNLLEHTHTHRVCNWIDLKKRENSL